MNKKNQSASIAFLLMLCILAGCGKKTTGPPPSITIDSASGSTSTSAGYYHANSKFRIYYSASSTANIKIILFSESAVPSAGIIPAVPPPVSKTTAFLLPNADKNYYETAIPDGASILSISIQVTDINNVSSPSIIFTAKNALYYQAEQ
jgi:hypothetical protein